MNIERAITPRVLKALKDTPAVMIVGPRQAGKSTLVQTLAAGPHPARYVTLDDLRTLEAARRDPIGLIEGESGALIIDEIQRAPELLLPVKAAIDADRRPGRFILTGSAQVMLLPNVSESLTGRVEIHTLWPFSQAELEGVPSRAVELLLDPDSKPATTDQRGGAATEGGSRADLIGRISRGGYPEATQREDTRREEWLSAYLTTSVQRDLRDLANIERLTEIPAVLASIAARVRAPLNKVELSSSVGIPRTTLERYLTLLEHAFLIDRVGAFHTNRIKQLTKAPKMLVCDSALLCHLLRFNRDLLGKDNTLFGSVLECFVGMELVKQIASSPVRATLEHMRTAAGAEVDFVLRAPDGRIAAIEVKGSATVRGDDFKHLERMRDGVSDERFIRGVVLYAGDTEISFGHRLQAWPIATLWSGEPPITT